MPRRLSTTGAAKERALRYSDDTVETHDWDETHEGSSDHRNISREGSDGESSAWGSSSSTPNAARQLIAGDDVAPFDLTRSIVDTFNGGVIMGVNSTADEGTVE